MSCTPSLKRPWETTIGSDRDMAFVAIVAVRYMSGRGRARVGLLVVVVIILSNQ